MEYDGKISSCRSTATITTTPLFHETAVSGCCNTLKFLEPLGFVSHSRVCALLFSLDSFEMCLSL